jgi:rubrerythrin
MYPEFEKVAKKEGYADAEKFFKEVAEVEAAHEARYKKLLEGFKGKKTFKEEKEIKWKCRNCGYIHAGKEAPENCPCCKHPKAYFERLCTNY